MDSSGTAARLQGLVQHLVMQLLLSADKAQLYSAMSSCQFGVAQAPGRIDHRGDRATDTGSNWFKQGCVSVLSSACGVLLSSCASSWILCRGVAAEVTNQASTVITTVMKLLSAEAWASTLFFQLLREFYC